mmetsp:Transcript_21574/g.51932  ORF Transcript_21574/g.51932 Transcript_21574/m.51932 type:complete len:214 (+) Transcript_21574:149-790(+)
MGAISELHVDCAHCSTSLPTMKLCTRCRCVYYCSRECQTRHWREHKTMCGSALQPGEAEALRKIAGTMNARASEPEPEAGAPMPGRAAAFVAPGSDHMSSEDLQQCCRRRNTKPCNTCQGSGMVQLQQPPKVPLHRLEGGATGFVVRERSCAACEGTGVMVDEQDDGTGLPRKQRADEPAVSIGGRCFRCQAASREQCTCSIQAPGALETSVN